MANLRYTLKLKLLMNRAKYNLSRLILFTIGAVLFTWVNSSSSGIAIAQTSLIPAPSLQEEKPAEILTSEITTLPAELKSAVLNDAVNRTSKTVSAMKILSVQQQQWSDGCLGLGKADEICTQVITPGYRVVVTDGLRNWTYRTDDIGDTVRLEQRNGFPSQN